MIRIPTRCHRQNPTDTPAGPAHTGAPGPAYREIVPSLIARPTTIEAAGNLPKTIAEYAGRVNTGTEQVSIALMTSPAGWQEPGQRPEFEEWTLVLRGVLVLDHADGQLEVAAGQAVRVRAGEWVRYRTPYPGGAEYVSVCLPAFSPATAHRDAA